MRKTTSAALALCVLAAAGRADDPEPDAAKAELKRLQGTWTVTKVISDKGKSPPVATFTFNGDKVRRATSQPGAAGGGGKGARRALTYKVKINTKATPHTIELTTQLWKSRKWTFTESGVYKFEKGELHLALGAGKNGPKDFKGKVGAVYVMTREKAKGKAKEKRKE
jgi:uncharacterized protein (TIGR03067 family)